MWLVIVTPTAPSASALTVGETAALAEAVGMAAEDNGDDCVDAGEDEAGDTVGLVGEELYRCLSILMVHGPA